MARQARKTPSSQALRPDRTGIGWRWVVLIFGVAVAYRGICFDAMGRHPLLAYPVVDAGHHHAWAARIAAGDTLGHGPDDVFKPPGYPYFLAGVRGAFGPGIAPVQWIQYLLGALGCVLTAVIAARWLGRAAGRIAGLLSAFYAPYVFFESQLLTPAVSIVLNLGALTMLLAWSRGARWWRLPAAGVLLGVSAAMRPDVLLPGALVVSAVLWWRRYLARRKLLLAAVSIVVGAGLVVGAVALRNARLVGQFIPVSSNAGINFYVGNAAGADGTSAVPVGRRWEAMILRVPQPILEKPATASRWWFARAWDEIAAAPGQAMARLGTKALALLNRREFRNNVCFHFMARRAWPLRWPFCRYAMILPLAAAGLVCLWRDADRAKRRAATLCALWVAGYWIVGIVFFVTARFRLPAVPLLIVPAAWAIKQIVTFIKNRNRKGIIAVACAIAAAGAVCWPAWLGRPAGRWVRDYVNLGNSLRQARRMPQAEQAYRDALRICGEDPDAHYLLAKMLLASGRIRQARRHLEHARRAAPGSPEVLLVSAEACRAAGNLDEARGHLRAILSLAGTCNLQPKRVAWARAHLMLADLEPEAAREHWSRAWSIDPATAAEAAFLQDRDLSRVLSTFADLAGSEPWNWYAQANYGLALLAGGRAEQALPPLRRAAKLAPEGKEGVRLHLARALLAAGRRAESLHVLDGLVESLPDCRLRRQAEQMRRRVTRPAGAGESTAGHQGP